MNTRTLSAALVLSLAAAGSAFAQEATSDDWLNATSTLTRAQVKADLAQARADGSLAVYRVGYLPSLTTRTSRADVLAALGAARASGELDRIDAEAHDFGGAIGGSAVRLAQAAR